MKGKHIVAMVAVGVLAIVLIAFVGIRALTSPNDTPSGVTTGGPTLTPVPTTPTVTHTVTAPPPSTMTVTPPPVTVTQTIKPMNPVVKGCADQGMNTDDWNMDRDTPSAEELELDPGSPLVHPMVDAPLVQVSAWSGPCFDTVMFTIDTTLIPDINNPEVGDRMWFDGNYETVTATDSSVVELAGDGDLRLTIAAPGDSWHYGDSGRPVQPVAVGDYHRSMGSDFGAIREVKGVEDFEGQVVFGIGVDKERKFAVHFAENDGRTAVVLRVANR